MNAPKEAMANFHDNLIENEKCPQYVMQTLPGCAKIIYCYNVTIYYNHIIW